MVSSTSRMYDLVVLGATGYTGALTAEHIALHLPTDIKWAVAGRSESKLSALTDRLKGLNADRIQPSVEIANLTPRELDPLVRKSKIVINTIGPYHLYSSPVVEACAKNGTHYLDVTGESPWTLDMIQKHHSLAKSTKAIMIPQIGIESAPSDLVVFLLATLIHQSYNSPVGEVVGTVHEFKGTPSGGTLATALSLVDTYSSAEMRNATTGNWSSSPIPHPKTPSSLPFTTKLLGKIFGVREDPKLGVLTTFVGGGINVSVVQRTWGLLDEGNYYGPKFSYREYATVRNRLVGILVHWAIALGVLALALPPLRWIVKRLVTKPGQGAVREAAEKDSLEYQAVAAADDKSTTPHKVFGRLRYEGSMYYLTGIFLAEAAMVLLKEEELVESLGGGLLTPAMLGQQYVDRLAKAGLLFEAEVLSK